MTTGTAIMTIGLLFAALGLSATFFYFKHFMIAEVAGLMWAFVGMNWSLNTTFMIICFMLAVGMMLSPAFVKKPKAVIPEPKPYSERLRERMDRYKTRGTQFKPKSNAWWDK